MSVAIVTGSGGLIGSESVRFFAEEGFDVVGVENDMRARFFGPEASTAPGRARLEREVDTFRHETLDIRAYDVVRAFGAFHRNRRAAAVYNLGGGRESNVSMLEAIALCEQIAGQELRYTLSDRARIGDHRWWISDLDAFKRDHPAWELTFGIEDVLRDVHDRNVEQWMAAVAR